MATHQYGSSQYGSGEAGSRSRTSTAWATGVVLFASVMLVMVGVLQFMEGLVAVFNDKFFVNTRNYTFEFDVTTWGWIHMIVGIIAVGVGFGLMSGAVWAKALGIALAIVSMVVNFAWLPYYPLWAIVVITLNVLVIWAITKYEPESTG